MKKAYKVAAIVVIVAATGFTASNAQNNDSQMSEMPLANVKALANGEGNGCKLSVLRICVTANGDHILYRNF